MSDDHWSATPVGVVTVLREEIELRNARIEELKVKLAKAVEALELADAALSGANMNMRVVELKVKAALADLTGESHE